MHDCAFSKLRYYPIRACISLIHRRTRLREPASQIRVPCFGMPKFFNPILRWLCMAGAHNRAVDSTAAVSTQHTNRTLQSHTDCLKLKLNSKEQKRKYLCLNPNNRAHGNTA